MCVSANNPSTLAENHIDALPMYAFGARHDPHEAVLGKQVPAEALLHHLCDSIARTADFSKVEDNIES